MPAHRSVIIQPGEEEDGAGDVDEGVYAVDLRHQPGVREEEALDGEFPENVQALLELDELQRMVACDVDGALNEGKRSECAAELVDLCWSLKV